MKYPTEGTTRYERSSVDGVGYPVEDCLRVLVYIIVGILVTTRLDSDIGFISSLGWGIVAGKIASSVLPLAWMRMQESRIFRPAMRLFDTTGLLLTGATQTSVGREDGVEVGADGECTEVGVTPARESLIK